MSFSFKHRSKTKQEAVDKLTAEAQCPEPVRAFCAAAIAATDFTDKDVLVSAYGHLCDGRSYEVSNAVVDVRPAAREVLSPDEAASQAQG